MSGAAIDVDIMGEIEIMELLRFHMWMAGNNYFSTWAKISRSKGHKLLADLINTFGLQHLATFEVMAWFAKKHNATYKTLRRVILWRGQDAVDHDGMLWDVVLAMYKDGRVMRPSHQ